MRNTEYDYIQERIINISELKSFIRAAYSDIEAIRKELEKAGPSMQTISELSKDAHLNLLQAKDFQFLIETMRTKCSESTAKFLLENP